MAGEIPVTPREPHHQKKDEPSDFFARGVFKLQQLFATLFLISMAILIFEVVMRYVFNSPTIWVHETAIFLCAICFLFGGLHSVSRNGHIRIVVLYDYVGDKVRRWLDVAIYATCGLATGMFGFAMWTIVVKSFWAPSGEFRIITSGSAWNPPYPSLLRAFLFVILIAMTIQFVVFVINHLRKNH